MEFSEAFRAEDIAKTDFFDFVVTPEDMGNDIVLHNNFPAWSRKSMGLFANNNNNNNNSTEDLHTNGPLPPGGGDAPDLHPTKEANNNILPNFADDSFWDTGGAKAFAAAAAAVNIKMESPTLEDIDDICWSSSAGCGADQADDSSDQRQQDDGRNTDGSIYTLTVVNGQDGPQPPTAPAPSGPPGPGVAPDAAPPLWYRPPDLNSILREGDEQLRQAMSAMDPSGQYQTSLDIDSIISILPSLPGLGESLNDPSSIGQGAIDHGLFNNGSADPGHAHPGHNPGHHSEERLSATCDDSGFVESKDDAKPQPTSSAPSQRSATGVQKTTSPSEAGRQRQQQQQQQAGSYAENNNDWAFSNHNDGGHSTAESLLRSALQGGKSYLNQYNGLPSQQHLQQDNKTLTELGPPGHPPPGTPDHASLGLFMSNDGMLPIDGGLLFNDAGMYNGPASSGACTSTTCMDDILLSPLDDYEKLKMIENEVAESAKRYGVTHTHQVNGLGHGHYGPPASATGSAVGAPPTPAARPKKKSSKRSGDRPPAKAKSAAASGVSGPLLGTSTPSANGGGASAGGARRERSLHHCTICSKAFKDKYSVNVHIRTHTGEKPFACSVCGKSFRQKAHLAKHYHTHIVQKSEHLGPSKSVSTKAR